MAGRIPRHFIDDLVARSDLVEVIGQSVALKKKGRDYLGLCPFHNEKSPSFSVSPDKQFYYCFGCHASGNALTFLMEHDRLEFVEAVEALARLQGVEVPREEGVISSVQQEEERRRKAQRVTQLAAMQKACEFFQAQLAQPEGLAGLSYLKEQRGLNEATLQQFALGVAPEKWDALKKHLQEAGVSEQQQLELGLLAQKEDSGRSYDRFRNRVIFPIRNAKGEVLGFGGRVLDAGQPKYLNSPETPLFHKGQELYGLYEARKAGGQLQRLLVVEGYMDVVALTQQGVQGSVATLGTATTREHLQRIFRLVNEVVFCFDGDRAGSQAAARALDQLLPLLVDGRHARFLFLPQGEDPDTLVRKEGAGLFEQRINSALPVGEYLMQQLRAGLDLQQLDGQTQLAERARAPLQALPPGLFKARMTKALTQLTGLDEVNLAPETNPSLTSRPPLATPGQAVRPSNSRQQEATSAIEKLFRLLCRYPDLVHQVPQELDFSLESDPLVPVLVKVLQSLRSQKVGTSAQTLLSYWTGTQEGEVILQQLQSALEFEKPVAEQEIIALCQRLLARSGEMNNEQRYSQLLEALKTRELSDQEHQELMQLMQTLPPALH